MRRAPGPGAARPWRAPWNPGAANRWRSWPTSEQHQHITSKGDWIIPVKDKEARQRYHNKYRRERYAQDAAYRQKQKDCARERKQRLRAIVQQIKVESTCKECGENHVACLDFHHRSPKKKKYTIENMVAGKYALSRIMLEIQKCDVLCANCHRKKHWKSAK